MLRLTSASKLQAVMSGAPATTQPQCTVSYSEQTSTTYLGDVQRTVLTGATDVDILAAPSGSNVRDVDFISFYNRDTASVTITCKYDVSATDSIIITATIGTLEYLEYTHSGGWKTLDAQARLKTVIAAAAGASGDVQYNGGGSAFAAESAFNYDAVNNILAVDNIRLGVDGSLRFDEHASAPATPASGNVVTYSKANGRPYGKDDTGQEFEMFASQRAAGGRLTLTSATPVLVTDVLASTSIFYALYLSNQISLYDGTVWAVWEFTELTNTTTDATKNPAAVANDSNYDLFVWNDAGTLRLGRGPAWSTDTSRGTGAGTTELVRVNGTFLNAQSITNGPAAQRGTYVGTVRSNGTATIDWKLGGTAANGSAGFLYVWNMYNRVNVGVNVVDSTDSWNYSTLTWRSKNNSTTNRVSMVRGLDEDAISVYNVALSANDTGGAAMFAGIGLDSTSAFSGTTGFANLAAANQIVPPNAKYDGMPGLGHHFIQAIEAASAVGTTTWQGDGGAPTFRASGLSVNARA